MASVLRQEPLRPTLLNSPTVLVATEEQKGLVRRVLDVCCSDTRFAEKAYEAIRLILAGNNVRPPVVNSLSPSSAVIGTPSFTLHVFGTGFDNSSKIMFNGFEEPTTFVSATEVTTGVNMDVWLGPSAPLPVAVVNGNVQSDPKFFQFTL